MPARAWPSFSCPFQSPSLYCRVAPLIENKGEGPVKGAPNAWRLTARGEQVQGAISVHTAPRAG